MTIKVNEVLKLITKVKTSKVITESQILSLLRYTELHNELKRVFKLHNSGRHGHREGEREFKWYTYFFHSCHPLHCSDCESKVFPAVIFNCSDWESQ